MKVRITLSANAGVAIHIGEYRIWVDALHTIKQPGFSAVDPTLRGKMLHCEAFEKPDIILCTHCHPDHFSKTLIKEAKKLWPNAKVILPERHYDEQILIYGNEFAYFVDGLSLQFIRLPHEGQQYSNCVHYGVLITANGKKLLIPGDCATAAVELQKSIEGHRINLALLNFPWLTLKRGQNFVDEIMDPSGIVLFHLPFERDDTCGYREAAKKAVQKRGKEDTQLLCDPLQTIELDI